MLPAVALRSAVKMAARRGAAALACAALGGCSLLSAPAATSPASAPASAPAPSPGSVAATSSPPACPASPAKFTCGMRARIAEVVAYLKHRPGVVGVVLRDR